MEEYNEFNFEDERWLHRKKKKIEVFLKSQEAWLKSVCPSLSSALKWVLTTTYNLYNLGIKKSKIFIPDYDQELKKFIKKCLWTITLFLNQLFLLEVIWIELLLRLGNISCNMHFCEETGYIASLESLNTEQKITFF